MNLVVWHGSRRWDGWPEIRTSKKGRYEHGPGIYCTTSLNTASKYSKGGGRIIRMELDPDIAWLEGKRIRFEDVVEFVSGSKAIKKKRVLVSDLMRTFDRREHVRESGMIPASYLVNLAVNNECLSGEGSVELAEYLVANGVQASLYEKSSDDNWVVIFDPKAIKSVTPMRATEIDWRTEAHLPIRKQIELLTHQKEVTPDKKIEKSDFKI